MSKTYMVDEDGHEIILRKFRTARGYQVLRYGEEIIGIVTPSKAGEKKWDAWLHAGIKRPVLVANEVRTRHGAILRLLDAHKKQKADGLTYEQMLDMYVPST